jgi:ribosomal protein S18 acetylase RimI-like enzyme
MNLQSTKQRKQYSRQMIQISHNLQYPICHLEDVLFPLFEKYYTNDSLRVTIESADHIWCAYENGICIACALITDIGSNGGLYIILFGVKKSDQGRGIGTRLLESIIKWSRKHKHTFIYLHTEYDNQNAIRLYEKAGFQKQFSQPDYIEELPLFGPDVLPMMLFI